MVHDAVAARVADQRPVGPPLEAPPLPPPARRAGLARRLGVAPTPWRVAAAAFLLLLVVGGWRELWFLTDDAYITFRYISNRMLGYGYVWNPPPFPPVEGYSNFLWMVLLDVIWATLGIAPPAASPVVSLGFGVATLWQTWRLLATMWLPTRLEPARDALAFAALLGVCVNRTFLMWLSSGLETALFMFLVVWWVRQALRLDGPPSTRWLAGLTFTAALAALTRPDGQVFAAAALGLAAWAWTRGLAWRAAALGCAPLGLVAVHVVWRHAFYGTWAPNTYFAKHVSAWPEAGLRYAASFALEYAVWVWAALVVSALVAIALRRSAGKAAPGVPAVACVAVLFAHFAYFTLVIGGDHFEYRVYAHLVPLLFVSAVWAVGRLGLRPVAAVGIVVAWVVLSIPIPWVHHLVTRALTTRVATFELAQPVAPVFPRAARRYVAAFDALQRWLIGHANGVRLQEHRVFHRFASWWFPSRANGARLRSADVPVYVAPAVGVAGWTLPHVAIIDTLGLNDAVIARTPLPAEQRASRRMAHDRHALAGYVECFEPNVAVAAGLVTHTARQRPLTAERVAGCERFADLFVDLAAPGLFDTAGRARHGSAVDLSRDSPGLELGTGWMPPEPWPGAPRGRWTGPEAVLRLARRGREAGLLIDLTCARPEGETAGRIEVGGHVVRRLPGRSQRHRLVLDVGNVPDRVLEIRFLVDNPYVPSARDPTSRDGRQLGVFVHEVRLIDVVLPDAVDLGGISDGSPGLGPGWWASERWSPRLAGRWTRGEAELHLGRRYGESALLVDATFQHRTTGITTGRVEVNGTPTARFRRENGRGLLVLGIPAGAEPVVRAHLVVDHPFVPGRLEEGIRDDRVLGMFVHAAHLVSRGASESPAYPSALEPAAVPPTAAPFQHGWGAVGVAPDGRRGRWTDGAAELMLGAGGPGTLTVELAPGGDRWARGRIEADGMLAGTYVFGPAGGAVRASLPAVSGLFIKVRVVTDYVSRPAIGDGLGWPTEGVLVESVRFDRDGND